MQRYITTWRKPGEKILEWDHYVSETIDEVARVIENIKKQGVHQYHTYPIGDLVTYYSSRY